MLVEDGDPALKSAGESLMDPMALNLVQWPQIAEVPYNVSTLEAGDCIWMPGATLHQVHSMADETGRNLQAHAFSLFSIHPNFIFRSCGRSRISSRSCPLY